MLRQVLVKSSVESSRERARVASTYTTYTSQVYATDKVMFIRWCCKVRGEAGLRKLFQHSQCTGQQRLSCGGGFEGPGGSEAGCGGDRPLSNELTPTGCPCRWRRLGLNVVNPMLGTELFLYTRCGFRQSFQVCKTQENPSMQPLCFR